MAKTPKPPITGLYQRPGSPFWYYDFRVDGKRYRGPTGETDQKLAGKKLHEIESRIKATAALGLASDAAGKTVEDATYHLACTAMVSLDGDPIPEGTRHMYRIKGGHLDRLLRTCGGCEACATGNTSHPSMAIADLKLHHVTKYRDQRLTAEGAAASTVKKELNTLASAIKQAATVGWCKPSLAVDLTVKLKANSKPKLRWLTPDEYLALLDALNTSTRPQHLMPRLSKADPERAARKAAEHRERIRDRQLFVTLGCFAGAELGALERLDWTDIDFDTDKIRIPGTKTKARDRIIDLDPVLRQALLKVHPHQRTGLVLRPWQNVRHDLGVACTWAGIPKITPHGFRHTFASWLVQAGVPTFVVAKLMGHRDSTMVELYYGHLSPRTKSDAMAKLPSLAQLYPDCSHLVITHEDYLAATARAERAQAVGTLEHQVEGDEDCAQIVPKPLATGGAHGVSGAAQRAPASARKGGVLDEKHPVSVVPRDGVEPPTRGFSVPFSSSEKPSEVAMLRPKLRVVR